MLDTLLQSTLSLAGLFEAALSGQPPAVASAWLQRHLAGALMNGAATLSRVVAEQYIAAESHEQQVWYSSFVFATCETSSLPRLVQ